MMKRVRRWIKDSLNRRMRDLRRARMRYVGGFRSNDGSVSPLLSGQAGNDVLREQLERGDPCMVARYGVYELRAALAGATGESSAWQNVIKRLHFNAGVFPNDPSLVPRFSKVYLEATRSIDVFGISLFRQGYWKEEEWLFQEFCPGATLIDIKVLDAFRYQRPWTSALRGKDVLVVHPFADSIQQQYGRRHLLFADEEMLPEFNSLRVVPAVQSIAGNEVEFDDWFAALASMEAEIASCHFDVAIVGAGAYGLPLAAFVRSLGRIGIHAGGVTQLLFGIWGNRWETRYPDLPNEYWVRPKESERPSRLSEVEQGCYW